MLLLLVAVTVVVMVRVPQVTAVTAVVVAERVVRMLWILSSAVQALLVREVRVEQTRVSVSVVKR